MRGVCERLRAYLGLGFNFLGAATARIVTAARATNFALLGVSVSLLLGPSPLALSMQRVYEHLRADSRLGFIFVGAATACIVNAARV